MKKLLLILITMLLFASIIGQAQVNEICKERGHIHLDQFYPETSDTGTFVVDTDDFTYLIKKSDFKIAYKCLRCGEIVKEPVCDTVFKIPNKNYTLETKELKWEILPGIDSKYDIGRASDQFIKLSDILEYEQECYNDSTWIMKSAFELLDLDDYIVIGDKDDTFILCRKPKFIYFAKWLKNKYGKL